MTVIHYCTACLLIVKFIGAVSMERYARTAGLQVGAEQQRKDVGCRGRRVLIGGDDGRYVCFRLRYGCANFSGCVGVTRYFGTYSKRRSSNSLECYECCCTNEFPPLFGSHLMKEE
jgi:hypothetical protein